MNRGFRRALSGDELELVLELLNGLPLHGLRFVSRHVIFAKLYCVFQTFVVVLHLGVQVKTRFDHDSRRWAQECQVRGNNDRHQKRGNVMIGRLSGSGRRDVN